MLIYADDSCGNYARLSNCGEIIEGDKYFKSHSNDRDIVIGEEMGDFIQFRFFFSEVNNLIKYQSITMKYCNKMLLNCICDFMWVAATGN